MNEASQPSLKDVALEYLDLAGQRAKALQLEVEHSERLATLGLVATTAAHEVNNLLHMAMNRAIAAQAIADDPERLAEYLEGAISGIDRAAKVMEAMMSFSRPNGSAADASVADCVAASLMCIARDPAKDGIDVQITCPPGISVAMDALSLQQVLINLILNAIKALTSRQRRGGEIQIQATQNPDGRVSIRFADTGPGLAQKIADSIFNPFVSSWNAADSPNPRDPSGHGLGLAVCRQLIERADGRISVQSTPGKGAIFTIDLPSAHPARAKAG